MDNQHRKISGYRELNETEIKLMNLAKTHEGVILEFIEQLRDLPDTDKRWLAIGNTHIEQGFMALVRSIAKPRVL